MVRASGRLSFKPLQGAAGSADAGGQTGLQQVAASRRLPIKHFAYDEYARAAREHETIIDLGEGYATRGRDGALDREGAGEPKRQRVDQAGECGYIKRGELARGDLVEKSDGDG